MKETNVLHKKKVVAPKLRFKGFEDSWIKSRLGDIAIITTGNTPSTTVAEYYNGPKLFVSPADINENRYVYKTKTTLTDLGFKQGRKITIGSILFVCIGSTIGKVAQATDECLTNQQINALDAINGFDNNFIYAILERNGKKIKLLAGTQAVPQINKTDFSNFKYNFPTLPEQQKIAAFLSAVDEKMQLLNRKKELLEQYKKGVMQQLFSGKLRFKDGNGKAYPKWEEKKLGDVLDYIQPTKYLVESTEYDDSYETPVLTAGKTFILGYTNETKNIYKENLPVVLFDDFTTATQFVDFPFKAKSSAMKILVPKKHENIRFIYAAMQLIKFEIGGHGRHWISQYALMNISYPCLEEQKKIADFLTAIDVKIESLSKQITQTQTFKKGLLQQMFV